MNIDFEKEQFAKAPGYGVFVRKSLRKISMFRGKSGTIAVITRILDPETLETTTIRTFWLDDTIRVVLGLYLKHFSGLTES